MCLRGYIVFAVLFVLFLSLPSAQSGTGRNKKMAEAEDEFHGATASSSSSSSSIQAKDASLLDASMQQQQSMHTSQHATGRRLSNEQLMSQQGKFDLEMKYCVS